MYTWGTMDLNVQSMAEKLNLKINEEPVISLPGSTDAQSILIGSGRGRLRYSITGLLNYSDYNSLKTDWLNFTSRTLTLGDVSMQAYIEQLSFSRSADKSERFRYSSTFVEK